ncbi:MAG: response regulator [Acidimicrobiales bacterium]
MGGIRVGIVDDQHLVRSGLAAMLKPYEEISVVGEASDGIEAIELAKSVPLDVMLMDLRMPHIGGIAAIERIIAEAMPPPRICILTMFEDDDLVLEALGAGASGFILKDTSPTGLRDAIMMISAGTALFAPAALSALVAVSDRRTVIPDPLDRPGLDSLTSREREILDLVAQGYNNAEIAEQLTVSTSTVKTHVSRVLAKLELRDRVHAVLYAHGKTIAP